MPTAAATSARASSNSATGKILRETDYYAQPFQAPEWRAQGGEPDVTAFWRAVRWPLVRAST